MKATRDSLLKLLRLSGLCIAALLLCQCELPPRQAWQAIQSNGLFTYWGQGNTAPRPPFGAGPGYSQRYAASRSTYNTAPRYGSRPLNYWSYPRTNTPYLAPSTQASRYPTRSYAGPTHLEERVGPARPAPRLKPRSTPPSVTRIPVEEPEPAPSSVARKESPAPAPSVTAKSNGTVPAPTKPVDDLPYGTSVAGRPNMVNSPYAGKTQLVDISGMTAGQTVKCPYSGKLFKVPSSQQASNNAEPKLESKLDTPKMSAEPKAEDKKP